MRERRISREYALQALYAQEMSGDDVEPIYDSIIANADISDELKEFARDLLFKTVAHVPELDKYIKKKSTNWDFERITVLDKLIMRMAICEFLYFDDIPPKVSITEAIEIGKKFSTDDSSAFINGILDAVFRELKEQGRILG